MTYLDITSPQGKLPAMKVVKLLKNQVLKFRIV